MMQNQKKIENLNKVEEYKNKNKKNHQELMKIQEELKELTALNKQVLDLYLLIFNVGLVG
mgnify:CR=1 FL=1